MSCLPFMKSNEHPTKCEKCGGKMLAVITTNRHRTINEDGTLGEYTDGGTHDLSYYECEDCSETVDV